MDLGRQWNERLRLWAEALPALYYREALPLEASFFVTLDHLTLSQALEVPTSPAPPGTSWGRKWEYGWFFTQVTVPPQLEGQSLVLKLGFGSEMLVWVDGEERGSIDREHPTVPLTGWAKAGTVYSVAAEVYAGHGPRLEGAGPVAFGRDSVPQLPPAQVQVAPSSLCVWNEPLFQAAMDYLTLYSLLQKLPEKSLRAMEVAKGLKQFTRIADLELPEPQLTQSLLEADRVLTPLLNCQNGSTAPLFTVFGQSHLDLAWLWPQAETIRKTARTYANQLALMERYPDYHFLLCEPPIPQFLQEHYPQLYRRVAQGVARGSFYPEGAMWVESDTNIPSGESLARQFILGKRYFRTSLGVDSLLAWMPDTFGFSAQLPQIMAGCGVPYFATQKLLRQDPEAESFPYNLFWWEGIDGSRVLAHIYKKNNAVFTPAALIERWEEDRTQAEGLSGMLFPYGHGDGGGGPTREMVEMAMRCTDLEGAPRCRFESPVEFFRRAEQEEVENTFRGELYLAWHRGTYTAQARTKKLLRRSETALKQVELALALRLAEGEEISSQKEEVDRLWKVLLFHQFHDIAAGASIQRVHAQAEEALAALEERCLSLLAELLGPPGEEEALFNSLPWPRSCRGVEVPPQGVALLPPSAALSGASAQALPGPDGPLYVLSNPCLTCVFDGMGELVSLKKAGEDFEYLAGKGNRLLLFKDVNTCYDAWEIGSMYSSLPVPLPQAPTVTLSQDEEGAALVLTRAIHHSTLRQTIRLAHQGERLDFITQIDWQERHKLLKVAFPLNISVSEAIHEVPFGLVKRPTHGSRQADKDQYEVPCQRYSALSDGAHGAAVLNDCKYGVSVRDGQICLTLLRAPLMPDQTCDQGSQSFTYSLYPFTGPFPASGVLRQALDLNEPLRPVAPASPLHPLCLSSAGNILIDTVKPADTVPGAILVRAYEATGMSATTSFTLSPRVRRVEETNLLEEDPRPVPHTDAVFFRPFEIKTFLLYL